MDSFRDVLDQTANGDKASSAGEKRPITLLFADLVGSTQMFRDRGDAAARLLLKQYTDLLLPQITKHKGTLIKTIGDAIMATFPKPKQCLQSAIHMQRALAQHNQDSPPADQLQVRIGVHHGQAIVEADDVYGDAVNTAARIEAEASSGKIYTSLTTWQTASSLDTEIVKLGKFKLKGIAEKLSLVNVLWNADEITAVREKHLSTVLLPSLADAVKQDKCILVLGGLSLGDRAGSIKGKIAKKMAAELGVVERRAVLGRLATLFEEENSHDELVDFVKQEVEKSEIEPAPMHLALAALPFHIILSTDFDRRMETALTEAGRPFKKFCWLREANPAIATKDEIALVKILGDVDDPDSLAITEDEIAERLNRLRLAPEELLGSLATSQLLFLGFRWNDREFRRLNHSLTAFHPPGAHPNTGISSRLSAGVRGRWRRTGLSLAQSEESDFATRLAEQIQKLAGQSQHDTEQESQSLAETQKEGRWKRPYKFLSYYTEEDELIFFGRQDEIRKVFSQVVSHRLVLLHAPSGAGKTSLLNAGVIPALRREGFAVISRRTFKDPEQEIRKGVAELLQRAKKKKQSSDWTALSLSADLSILLAETSKLVGKPLLIVIDQFEEFFVRLPKKMRITFIDQLSKIIKQPAADIRILLSMRHDFLHHLAEFKTRIPDVFHHDVGMGNLSPEGMEEAIREPAALAGLHYQDGLITRIMDDLGTIGFEPPQLQIVCDRLYDELAAEEELFTTKHYARLGEAKGILGSYLERFLSARSAAGRELGRQVLKALITSVGTKGVITAEEVARESEQPVKSVRNTLNQLLEARLVRKIPVDQSTCYELSHEYLIEEIGNWVEEKERNLKRARELLRQELINYERFGLLMTPARTVIIRKEAATLQLSEDENTLLKKSISKHRSRKIIIAISMLLLLVFGLWLSFFITRQLQSGLCQDGRQEMATVWDSTRKKSVKESFQSTQKPYAQDTWNGVRQTLERYTNAWTAMHQEACLATKVKGSQSNELLTVRMDCLAAKKNELQALLDAYQELDAVMMANANRAALFLSPISRCANISALSTRVHQLKGKSALGQESRIRRQLAKAKAFLALGNEATGKSLAAEVLNQARSTKQGPIEAEAIFVLGNCHLAAGRTEAAYDAFRESWLLAEAVGNDEQKASAAVHLIRLASELKKPALEAQRWQNFAMAAIQRGGDQPELKAKYYAALASVFFAGGQFVKAVENNERALEILRKHYGSSHPAVATAYHDLGQALAKSGALEKAAAAHQKARAIRKHCYGPFHPILEK